MQVHKQCFSKIGKSLTATKNFQTRDSPKNVFFIHLGHKQLKNLQLRVSFVTKRMVFSIAKIFRSYRQM